MGDYDDPDYIPDSGSEEGCPPSVVSEGLEELPQYPGLSFAAPVAGKANGVHDDSGHDLHVVSGSPGPHSPYSVAKTSNINGLRKWNRRNFCPYCEQPHAKLTRHLQRVHATEVQVVMALAKPKGSAEKRKAFLALAKLGNYRHNIAVRAGEKKGELVACNRARGTTSKTGNDYLACNACKGFFLRATLWRHKRICEPMGGGRVQAAARAAMPATRDMSAKLRKVLDSMCLDHVSLLSRTDESIIMFGETLCAKLGNECKDIQNIRNRMRELGRLLEVMRREDPELTLKDVLVPGRFSALCAGVRAVCGFDSETNTYGTPSLALKIGQSVKLCADQVLAQQIEGGQDTALTRQFIELYNLQWNRQVSRHAHVTLHEAKWNRAEAMPVAADIQLMHKYLDQETESKLAELKAKPTPEAYKAVAELVLARLILFNRRRQGEASAMTVDAYRKATASEQGNHPEVTSSLTSFERHLAGTLLRVVVRGKKGRGVPILLTREMREAVDILLESREAAGVSESQYVFASTLSDHRPLRGSDCLRKCARLSGVVNPETLTSTKLRKHIATLSQVLNLKDNELDLLAGFLGHDIRVHRDVYRMPEATSQLALVSKLLLASEKGMGAWRGKSLNEIEIDDIPGVEEDDVDEDDALEDAEVVASAERQENEVTVEEKSTPKATASRARTKRRMWTPEENRAISVHFSDFISRFEIPGKADCIRVIAAEGALASRSWKDVKHCVYNRIQKRRKHGH